MKTLILLLVLAGIALAADGPKSLYRVLKFGPRSVGIYCTNGGDPTVVGNPTGHVLEVSCGN